MAGVSHLRIALFIVAAVVASILLWDLTQDEANDARKQAERIAALEDDRDEMRGFIDALGPIAAQAGVEIPSADEVVAGDPTPVRITGDQGPQGPRGATGPTGDPGPQGDPGPAGSGGATGASGPSGADGAAGDPGSDGAPGADGADGLPGPAGAQGEPGPAGADGAQGPTGPQGPAGPLPAGIEVPAEGGGTCIAVPDADQVFRCPAP